jgi:hypothetical protein
MKKFKVLWRANRKEQSMTFDTKQDAQAFIDKINKEVLFEAEIREIDKKK